MKYGINVVEGQLKAISEFIEGELPEGFEEITLDRYNELLNNFKPFSVWDDTIKDFVENIEQQQSFEEQAEINTIRQKLSFVVSELVLAERLNEDTSVLQKQFDDLSKEYKQRKNIPPKVYAGGNQTITLPKNEVLLSGKAMDKDGKITSVTWIKTFGGKAVIEKVDKLSTKVKKLEAGVYRFKLLAKDDRGAEAASDTVVNVLPKEAIDIVTSPKQKLNIPFTGTTFKIKVKSNTDWYAIGKVNSSVSPSSGRGNDEVIIRVHRNQYDRPLKGSVEFLAGNKTFNFIWSQKANEISQIDDEDLFCFDLQSNIIMANGRSKKLKNIKLGDELLSLDFPHTISPSSSDTLKETFKNVKKATAKVIDFGTQKVKNYSRITLINNTIIDVTNSHPLLCSKDEKDLEWLPADELRAGMYLFDKNGKLLEVESKRKINESLEIGILEVEGQDNYFVQGVVVHNPTIVRKLEREEGVKSAVDFDANDEIAK